MISAMDATTIDKEFEQLQVEFQEVAKTVASLALKMQAAEKAGDANATEWLGIEAGRAGRRRRARVKTLLLAIHVLGGVAQAQQGLLLRLPKRSRLCSPPVRSLQNSPRRNSMGCRWDVGGTMGGGKMGGGMFGGYYGGGFEASDGDGDAR